MTMTPQKEAVMLYHHGTVRWELTPNTVYRAAVQDIHNREFNKWLREARRRRKPGSPGREQLPSGRRYGFLAKHVNKAGSAAALLKLALEDQKAGRCSQVLNTYALYDNGEALAKAHTLALEAGS